MKDLILSDAEISILLQALDYTMEQVMELGDIHDSPSLTYRNLNNLANKVDEQVCRQNNLNQN